MDDNERVTYFGETDARNKRVRFGIKKKDRSRHMYVIGKTGMGKSTFLENLAIQDIQNGEGLAFIDPHGKSADFLLEYIPEHRIKDVVYFAPFDLDHPISFNVLEDVGPEKRHLVVNGLMSAFKRIWVDAFSARMEYILSNIMLALLEYPESTLMGVNRMLVDKDFRTTVVNNITDPSVRSFWVDEYAKYTDKFAAEAAPAIQNKVGQFVANPLVRNIIGQPKSSFDIRAMMDQKKIFIVNLSKGRVGEANANLLGAMLITKIYLAAMSRADLNEKELKEAAEFYLYVDEFQSFANESFADILSEARKYKLSLTIAHQYIEQMTEEVRAAVFGNVGSMVVFRVGAYDAAVFEKEFVPQFSAEDLVNLQQYQMYLKLMIDYVTSPPFSAMGMAPIAKPEKTYVKEIIDSSRAQFAHPREQVEDMIRQWHIDKILPGPNAPSAGGGSSGYGAPSSHPQGGQSGQGGGQGGGYAGGGDRGGREGGFSGNRDNRDSAPRSSGGGSQGAGNYGDRPPRRDSGFAGGSSANSSMSGSGDRGGRGGERFGERSPERSSGGAPNAGSFAGRSNDRGGDRPAGDRTGSRFGERSDDRPRRDDGRGPSSPKTEKPFAKAFESLLAGEKVEGLEEQDPTESVAASPRGFRNDHEVHKNSSVDSIEPAVDREKSLREAISLNYLKSRNEEEQKVRNEAKTAKPQNILDLKNALLGVLGEVPSNPEREAPASQPQSLPQSRPQPQPQSVPIAPAPAPTPAQQTHAPRTDNPAHHAQPRTHAHDASSRTHAVHPERQHAQSGARSADTDSRAMHASHPVNAPHTEHRTPTPHAESKLASHHAAHHKPHAETQAQAHTPAPAAQPAAPEVDIDTLSKLLS